MNSSKAILTPRDLTFQERKGSCRASSNKCSRFRPIWLLPLQLPVAAGSRAGHQVWGRAGEGRQVRRSVSMWTEDPQWRLLGWGRPPEEGRWPPDNGVGRWISQGRRWTLARRGMSGRAGPERVGGRSHEWAGLSHAQGMPAYPQTAGPTSCSVIRKRGRGGRWPREDWVGDLPSEHQPCMATCILLLTLRIRSPRGEEAVGVTFSWPGPESLTCGHTARTNAGLRSSSASCSDSPLSPSG